MKIECFFASISILTLHINVNTVIKIIVIIIIIIIIIIDIIIIIINTVIIALQYYLDDLEQLVEAVHLLSQYSR